MTALASLRKIQSDVVRIGSPLKIFQVTANAVRRRAFVSATDMALGALQCGVRSGKRKSGELQVIECSTEPCIHVVTLLTGNRKSGLHVTRPGRRLVVFCMAGIALR